MANILESRDLSGGASLSSSVVRVACIGDSMTYGGGVTPREALPAALLEPLNAAFFDQLVWVDNLGLNGANLWHSWQAFRDILDERHYDAVLFSVCQNDSQLFDMHSVTYETRDYTTFWQPGTVNNPAAEALIADFGQTCRRRGILGLLYFYSRLDQDEPIIATVAEMAGRHEVPFVDMYSFFTTRTALTIEEFRTSPFDGHPSGHAHQFAARQLTQDLRTRSAFAAAPRISGELAASVATAVEEMAQRIPADALGFWADRVLGAKERAARRRSGGAADPAVGDVAAARARIAEVYEAWRRSSSDMLAARSFSKAKEEVWRAVPNLASWITKLDELVYVAEHYAGTPLEARIMAVLTPNPYYDQPGRLRPLPNDWRTYLKEIRQAVETERLRASALVSRSRWLLGTFGVYLNVLAQFDKLLSGLIDIPLAAAARIEVNSPSGRLVQILDVNISAALSYIRSINRTLEAQSAAPHVGRPVFTRVEVTVEAAEGADSSREMSNVIVEGDYLAPARSRHSCRYLVGVGYPKYMLSYEIPLMFCGSLKVRLADGDPGRPRFLDGRTRFTRVEVFNIDGAFQPVVGAPRAIWERDRDRNVAVIDLADIALA